MELRYPILLIVGIIIILIFLFFYPYKRKTYEKGTKIANTKYVKANPYFQKRLKSYQRILLIVKSLCIFSIIISLFLMARPSKIETKNNQEYNRDIVLCMDISSSVYELDNELIKNMKNTVKSLKGERFAISIFNTTSVTLVPLTEDYEYVLSVLDNIQKGIDYSINGYDFLSNNFNFNEYRYYTKYIEDGTIENAKERGSSIIGDGLASCIYNFSNMEEERTRIIILATDNDDYGKKPVVSFEEAASLAKKKKIMVFGIGTLQIDEKNEREFQSILEKTGGKYYSENTSSMDEIVNDIEKTSKSLLEGQIETQKIDIPEIPFLLLMISTISFIVLNKKVTG